MNAEAGEVKNDRGKEEEKVYYGFDHYPERRTDIKRDIKDVLFYESGRKAPCEESVIVAMKIHPMVRILVNALEKAGCPFDITRHVTCERCDTKVTGGYDTEMNQIVICQNHHRLKRKPEITMVHELIHMYDYCVNKVDFKRMDHLACSEIRAANLSHCSFSSSVLLGQSSPINIKETHKYCVKMKAIQSVMVARNVDFKTAYDCVDKVFEKCYNDLEPIGRRVRRNSPDPLLAYRDSIHYGYSEPTSEGKNKF